MDVEWLCLLGLLAALVVLLIVAVVLLWRIASLLKRLAARTAACAEADPAEHHQESRPPTGQFEEFLAEDPCRIELSKSEQFAAFRQWRQKRGFTWGR
jgi:hypothetical protein